MPKIFKEILQNCMAKILYEQNPKCYNHLCSPNVWSCIILPLTVFQLSIKKYYFCCVLILTGYVCKPSLMCVWAVFILKRCSVVKIEKDRTRGNRGRVNFLHRMTEPITISDHTHTHTYRFISSQNPNIDGNFLMKKRKTRLT